MPISTLGTLQKTCYFILSIVLSFTNIYSASCARGMAQTEAAMNKKQATLYSSGACVLQWANSSLFFFKLINFFKLEANYFTVLWWFLPYIDMNQPWVYLCSPPIPLGWPRTSHLPPDPIPLGWPRTLTLSALLHASNLHWSSV